MTMLAQQRVDNLSLTVLEQDRRERQGQIDALQLP